MSNVVETRLSGTHEVEPDWKEDGYRLGDSSAAAKIASIDQQGRRLSRVCGTRESEQLGERVTEWRGLPQNVPAGGGKRKMGFFVVAGKVENGTASAKTATR